MFSIFKSKNNTEELNKIYQALDSIEEFIDRDSNDIAIDGEVQDEALSAVYDKVKSIASKLEKKNTSVLGVNGELLLLIEKMADGDFSERVQLKTDDPYLKYFAKSLNAVSRKLHHNFKDILNILREYENGKYIKTLDTDDFRDGEIKSFLIGINSLKDSISHLLKENWTFGYQLERTSKDLSENMRKVLDASDEQEKTLDEITYKITNIQEKAKETTNYTKDIQNSSKQMKEATSKSLNFANKTVTAMDDINSSTVAISEAIEVIDQIAFQTNILSLNAAVEAATAGDAGKGFAVVASEVRNLASRSADAAKSIKELVETATQKANEGKEISDGMIDGYKKLSSSIDEISSTIDKATTSTDEQLKEVQEINRTIKNLQEKTKHFVSVAHHTNEVGQNLQEISQKVLNLANKTEFEGKDEILKEVEEVQERELELV